MFALNKKRIMLICIICLALGLRLHYMLTRPFPMIATDLNAFYPDENVYYSFATLMYNVGFIQAFMAEDSLWVAPLNSIFIYILSYVLGLPIIVLRVISIILSIASVWLVYKIGTIYKNKNVGLMASFVVAIYNPIIDVSPTLLTEPLYIFLLLLGLYLFTVGFNTQQKKWFIMAGIILALATLTRSVLLLLPIFIIIVYYIYYRNQKKLLLNIGIFMVSFFVVLSPIMIKNFIVFHQFTISNGSGAALYLGSRADTEGDEPPYRGKDYNTGAITGTYSHLETKGDQLLKAAAIKNIKSDFIGYLYWDFKKIGRLLVGNQYYWSYPTNSLIEYIQLGNFKDGIFKSFNMLIAIAISVFGIFYLIASIVHQRKIHALVILIVYLLGISLPFLANHRYGLPIVILMSIMFASYFFGKEEKNNEL